MTKSCELCASEAKTYCESDQARLCWDCDARVHGANFLVARHSRSLLCRVCHSPTPWTGSGPKLCPTVSVCQSCLRRCCPNKTRDCEEEEAEAEDEDDQQQERDDHYDHSENYDDIEEEEEDDDDESCDDEDDCIEEDEDEENQVVPWSKPGQLPASSSSRSDQECSKSNGFFGRQSSPSVSDTAFS